MLTFAYYILKVIICSGILYGYYLLALKDKIFHSWNRFYLLAAVTLSLAAPLIKINIWQKPQEPSTQVIHLIEQVNANDEVVFEFTKHQQSFHINASNTSLFIYTIISALLLFFLLKTLLKINYLKRSNNCTVVEGINLFNTDAKGTPFSFFNNIFWNCKIDLNTSSGKQIFKHEVAHVREKHSYDKIFMNIVLILFWCNPIFWLIKKELNIIHEFIADKKAIEDNDTAAFAAMILQATYPQHQFTITNNFFYSPLKRRLAMLTKNNNPKINYLSRLLVLPLAALVFFAFTLKMKSLNGSHFYSGNKINVVIDAGHGGTDNGISVNNINEKDLTLSLAKEIKALNTNENINIILTRNADSSFGVKDRVNFANSVNADLFISLHVDGEFSRNSHSGLVVFIPANDNQYLVKSKILADNILQTFKNNYQLPVDDNLMQRERGVYILKENKYPSVLIETGFLTTQKDFNYLVNPNNEKQIAQNILKAIDQYAMNNLSAQKTISLDTMPQNKDAFNKSPEIRFGDPNAPLPLYIVDGKETSSKELNKMSPNNIERIDVLKGEQAIKQYGDKGKNGVVEITTKKLIIKEDTIPNEHIVTVRATAGINKQNNNAEPPFASMKLNGNDLRVANFKSTATPDMFAINADVLILKERNKLKEMQNKSNYEAGLIIINGKEVRKESLAGKLVRAKEIKCYLPNNDEAIKLFGEAAKDGAMIFTDATITDQKEKVITDTIPKKFERVFTQTETPPQFPGGDEAWKRYIMKVIQNNTSDLLKANTSGTCMVKFIVDKDGTVSDVTALSMQGTKLAEIAINAIKKGPKWNPATQNGHIVAAYKEQPVTFKLNDGLNVKYEPE